MVAFGTRNGASDGWFFIRLTLSLSFGIIKYFLVYLFMTYMRKFNSLVASICNFCCSIYSFHYRNRNRIIFRMYEL